MALLDKREIAARQLEGAIRVFMTDGDPLVAYTLAAPASQILRDLNRSNPKTISSAFTMMFEEIGINPNDYWKEYNNLSAKIKHAKVKNEKLDDTNFRRDIEFIIFMSITEWMLNEDNIVEIEARGKIGYPIREHMKQFIFYSMSVKRRKETATAFASTLNYFERRARIAKADSCMGFYRRILMLLLHLKKFLRKEL